MKCKFPTFAKLYAFLIHLLLILDQQLLVIPHTIQLAFLFLGGVQASSFLLQAVWETKSHLHNSTSLVEAAYWLLFTLQPYEQLLISGPTTLQHNLFWIVAMLFLLFVAIAFAFFRSTYLSTNKGHSLLVHIKNSDKLT
jgi:hypothetical protein